MFGGEKLDTNKQYTIVEVLIDDRKVICVSSLENLEAGDFAEIRFKNTNKFAQAKIISVFRNCEINNNFNTDLNVSIIRKLTDDEILITQNHLLSNKSCTKIFKYTGSKLSYFVDDNGVMNQRLEGEFLKKITIPESVIEISEGAFKEARVLEEISLNDGLEVIGDYAFEYTNMV